MKRRYSISLGLAAIGSIAYLALLGWYVYTLLQGGDTGYPVTVEDLPFPLILHICLAVIAAAFTWTAFFTNILPVALAACICYAIGEIIFYHYLLFCAPLIILTIVGSVFCSKQQKKKQDKPEEVMLKQKKTLPEKKQVHKEVHEKKPQMQRNTRQQMLTRRMQQNHNTTMQGNAPMFQANYVQPMVQPFYTPMQDPYAPLAQGNMMQPMAQPAMVQNGMYPYPVYNNEQFAAQQPMLQLPYHAMPANPNNAFQQGVPTAVQTPFPQPNQFQSPGLVNMQNSPGTVPQPHAGHTRGEGYFDDYGNFHPGRGQ